MQKAEIKNQIKKIFESKLFVKVLCGLGALLIALLIFSAGVAVGFHRESYEGAWGEHYFENLGVVHHGGLDGVAGHFPNSHGAVGKIIELSLPTMIVQDTDTTEKTVLLSDDTGIAVGKERGTLADLKVDDFVVVIGAPNASGQIEAKFIRIMPSSPGNTMLDQLPGYTAPETPPPATSSPAGAY